LKLEIFLEKETNEEKWQIKRPGDTIRDLI
jgi:hypothetical protein